MSIEVQELAYVGVYEETTYQEDHSGTPGDFLALPYVRGGIDLKGAQVPLNPQTGKMRLDGSDERVLGPKSCSAAIPCTIHSHGQDLDGDVTPTTKAAWPLARMLQTIMGGSFATTNASAQTTVQAGTTTTVVNVTASHGTRFEAGGAIGCEVVSGSGLIELREILSVTDDAVSVKQAFSATPVTGSAVRGAITFFMTENPSTSLQLLHEGREATDGAWYGGMQGGFKLQLPTGELGQIIFNLIGASWGRVGSSAATIPSYSIYAPMALNPIEVTCPTVGSTTRVALEHSAVTVDPNIVYAPQRSGKASQTIARMRRMSSDPLVSGTFTVPYEDDTWFTAHSARQDRALFVQIGNVPGHAWLISVPTIQIHEPPTRVVSGDGIAGQSVPYIARLDTAIGATSERSYSALRIHTF